jgi:hypothetical protein
LTLPIIAELNHAFEVTGLEVLPKAVAEIERLITEGGDGKEICKGDRHEINILPRWPCHFALCWSVINKSQSH